VVFCYSENKIYLYLAEVKNQPENQSYPTMRPQKKSAIKTDKLIPGVQNIWRKFLENFEKKIPRSVPEKKSHSEGVLPKKSPY
jgi:hypothetical protein